MKDINKKDIAVLITMTLIVSLCKIVYVPLALLLFVLPKEKFSSLKSKKDNLYSSLFTYISPQTEKPILS